MKHLDAGNARKLIMRMDKAASNGSAEWDQFYRRYSYDLMPEIPGSEISGFVSGLRAVGKLKEAPAELSEEKLFCVKLPLVTALIAFRELPEEKGAISVPDRRSAA